MSYRNNRPTQRPSSENEPVQQASPPPLNPAVSTPAQVSRSRHQVKKEKNPKKRLIIGIIIAVLAILLLAGWFLFGRKDVTSVIDSSTYQVVVLRDSFVNPTYFGKLSVVNDKYMKLTEVYYLNKKTEDPQAVTGQSLEKQKASDFELIKLGNEIHGPRDEIIIPTEQILYIENLKPDGQVIKAIQGEKSK